MGNPRQRAAAIVEFAERIFAQFNGDKDKIITWLNTKNPLLGEVKPLEMLEGGRIHRLIKALNG